MHLVDLARHAVELFFHVPDLLLEDRQAKSGRRSWAALDGARDLLERAAAEVSSQLGKQ
jgi:hypothetical protein